MPKMCVDTHLAGRLASMTTLVADWHAEWTESQPTHSIYWPLHNDNSLSAATVVCFVCLLVCSVFFFKKKTNKKGM